MNFIKVDNAETANKLVTLGFQVIDITNGIWTFLNEDVNTKLNFNIEDKKHIVYTDRLNI